MISEAKIVISPGWRLFGGIGECQISGIPQILSKYPQMFSS